MSGRGSAGDRGSGIGDRDDLGEDSGYSPHPEPRTPNPANDPRSPIPARAPRSGPPPDVLTIAGTAVDMAARNVTLDRMTPFARGGTPELAFSRLVGTPGALPDPWNLRSCTLTMEGTLVFSGIVAGYVDRYDDRLGWVRGYRALGLGFAGNYVPVTDGETLTEPSVWNLPGDDPQVIDAREGQSVGQIVAALLTFQDNANRLSAAGVGAYTSLSPPTLPAATTGDLANLTVIPPGAVRVAGERILPSLEAVVQQFHPNHFLYIQPDGTIRFLDPRTFPATTVTINGSDPRWIMPTLTRDASDNYSQVVVRGTTLTRAVTLQDKPWPGSTLPDGGLQEDFAWGTLTNAQAKAAVVPTDWSQPNNGLGGPMDSGTCSATDTTHVVINTTHTYLANQLAQGAGELLGLIILTSDTLNGLATQYWTARIIANTSTSGGSCTVTIDAPLLDLSYHGYQIYGIASGANLVGRRYRISNAAIAHTLQLAFPYPVAFVYAGGSSAEMVSSPMGIVWYSPTGGTSPPYNMTTVGLTIDPDGGLIYFNTPVYIIAGGVMTPVRWPVTVQAFLAVGYGTMTAVAPPTGYAGTLSTVEGVSRTKYITVLEWKDYSNQLNMQTFAAEVLDSVKDVVIEGSLPYLGMPGVSWLVPGNSVSIAGRDFVTGWEDIAIPVVSVDVVFQTGPAGTSYVTTLHLSNRRTPYDAANFLRPNLKGGWIAARLSEPFGAGLASSQEQSKQLQEQSEKMTREGTRPAGGFTGQVLDPGQAPGRRHGEPGREGPGRHGGPGRGGAGRRPAAGGHGRGPRPAAGRGGAGRRRAAGRDGRGVRGRAGGRVPHRTGDGRRRRGRRRRRFAVRGALGPARPGSWPRSGPASRRRSRRSRRGRPGGRARGRVSGASRISRPPRPMNRWRAVSRSAHRRRPSRSGRPGRGLGNLPNRLPRRGAGRRRGSGASSRASWSARGARPRPANWPRAVCRSDRRLRRPRRASPPRPATRMWATSRLARSRRNRRASKCPGSRAACGWRSPPSRTCTAACSTWP